MLHTKPNRGAAHIGLPVEKEFLLKPFIFFLRFSPLFILALGRLLYPTAHGILFIISVPLHMAPSVHHKLVLMSAPCLFNIWEHMCR